MYREKRETVSVSGRERETERERDRERKKKRRKESKKERKTKRKSGFCIDVKKAIEKR